MLLTWDRAGSGILAPFGLALGGLTMVGVPLVDSEPPTWLFLLGLLPSLFGLSTAGVAVGRGLGACGAHGKGAPGPQEAAARPG